MHLNLYSKIFKRFSQSSKDGEISDIIYGTLTRHIVRARQYQAGCDRIAATPLPYSYSVLLHRAVYCFCFILPFSLEAALGIWTPLIVGNRLYVFRTRCLKCSN